MQYLVLLAAGWPINISLRKILARKEIKPGDALVWFHRFLSILSNLAAVFSLIQLRDPRTARSADLSVLVGPPLKIFLGPLPVQSAGLKNFLVHVRSGVSWSARTNFSIRGSLIQLSQAKRDWVGMDLMIGVGVLGKARIMLKYLLVENQNYSKSMSKNYPMKRPNFMSKVIYRPLYFPV